MSKEIKRVSFEVEHYNGMTYMGFELSIKDDGTVDVIKTNNCSLADVDGDYIFDTENDLFRIQADEPISENEFEEIQNVYNALNNNKEVVFENDFIKVVKTGKNYDFIATVENKTDKNVKIIFNNEEIEDFSVNANDWIGLLADADGYSTLREIENNNFVLMHWEE